MVSSDALHSLGVDMTSVEHAEGLRQLTAPGGMAERDARLVLAIFGRAAIEPR